MLDIGLGILGVRARAVLSFALMSPTGRTSRICLARTTRLTCGLILGVSGATTAVANATPENHANDEHEHEHSDTHDHAFEIGVGPGLAYLTSDKDLALALHIHGLMSIGDSSWALGLGYEKLFVDGSHDTVSAVVLYHFADHWSAALAPGVTFEGDEVLPSAHLEVAYEVDFGRFHLGPSLELAVDPDEAHITLGLHIGFGL